MHPDGAAGAAHTIADVLFPAADARIVLALDRELARDALAADVLTRVVCEAADPDALAEGVQRLAEALDWEVRVGTEPGAEVLTVGRARAS